jgi:hypothetical protein
MTSPTAPTTSPTDDTTGAAPEPQPHRRKLHAFGLPGGSIRALLAVLIFAGIWAALWLHPERRVPDYLQNLVFIIMGHYFAARAKKDAGPEPGPPPLFLPRGTIRYILVLGFVAVTGALIYQHRLWTPDPATRTGFRLHDGAVTLILVAGFLLGVVATHVHRRWSARRRPPRLLEDVRAAVSLTAAVALLLLVFSVLAPDKGILNTVEEFTLRYRVEEVLAAIVGFYFGSRS